MFIIVKCGDLLWLELSSSCEFLCAFSSWIVGFLFFFPFIYLLIGLEVVGFI